MRSAEVRKDTFPRVVLGAFMKMLSFSHMHVHDMLRKSPPCGFVKEYADLRRILHLMSCGDLFDGGEKRICPPDTGISSGRLIPC
jgi:hypothetical protein